MILISKQTKGEKMKIEFNLSQKEYREKKDFLSSSDIKTLLTNPYKFKTGFESKKSDNLILGSAVHSLILEPQNFERDFIVLPQDLNLRTKEGKEIKANFEKEALEKDKELISYDLHQKALEISENFKKSKAYNYFKLDGKPEVSFFGKIEDVHCKCRTDYMIFDKETIIDLKTTNLEDGASPDAFLRNIANFKYYIQAAFYLKLTNAKDFYFIAIETQEPFMIGVYKLDFQSIEFGINEIKRALEIYKNLDKFENLYIDTMEFSKVQELTLPHYVYYQKGASY